MSFPSPLTVKVARSEQDSEGAAVGLDSRAAAAEGGRHHLFGDSSISDSPHPQHQHQLAKATMASGRKP